MNSTFNTTYTKIFSTFPTIILKEKKQKNYFFLEFFLNTFRCAESNGNEQAQWTGAWYERQSSAIELSSSAIRSNVGKSFVSILDWCWSVNGDDGVLPCGE